MIEELANRLCLPVVLENFAHQIHAYGGCTEWSDEVVEMWDQHTRLDHSHPESVRCTRQPIAMRGEVWGALHVLHIGSPTETSVYATERAAAAVAITLLGSRSAVHVVPNAIPLWSVG